MKIIKMGFISKVKSVGGSLMVKVPKDLTKLESIQDGQLLKIIKVEKIKHGAFGIFKGIGRFTKEDELDAHE